MELMRWCGSGGAWREGSSREGRSRCRTEMQWQGRGLSAVHDRGRESSRHEEIEGWRQDRGAGDSSRGQMELM